MVRIKIDLPASFSFSTEITPRITDINYGGHLGNDAILSLIHEARVRFLDHYGFNERNAGGPGIIMVDSVIVYKSESFYGDVLKIEVEVEDLSRSGCDFVFRMTQKETGKEIARAKTGVVFFDYKIGKVVRVPEKFAVVFSKSKQ